MSEHILNTGRLSQSVHWSLALLLHRPDENGCICHNKLKWWSNVVGSIASKKWIQGFQSGKRFQMRKWDLKLLSVHLSCFVNGYLLSKCLLWVKSAQIWSSNMGCAWTLAHGWTTNAYRVTSSWTTFWSSHNTATTLFNQLWAITTHAKRKIACLSHRNQEMLIANLTIRDIYNFKAS